MPEPTKVRARVRLHSGEWSETDGYPMPDGTFLVTVGGRPDTPGVLYHAADWTEVPSDPGPDAPPDVKAFLAAFAALKEASKQVHERHGADWPELSVLAAALHTLSGTLLNPDRGSLHRLRDALERYTEDELARAATHRRN